MVTKRFCFGHWEIYLDGMFYCTCEDSELSETLAELGGFPKG